MTEPKRGTPFICEICETPKRETNHWFMVKISRDGSSIEVSQWRREFADELPSICGEAHVIKSVQNWMEDRKRGVTT